MINTSKEIVFLVSGDELSKQCFGAIEDVCWALRKHFECDSPPENIRVYQRNVTFVRFFDPIYEDEVGRIFEEEVLKLFKLTNYSSENRPSEREIQELILYSYGGNRPAPTRAYFFGIKLGVQLFFLNLWRRKAVLLPYDFDLPRAYWLPNEPYCEHFFSPVSAFLRSFHDMYGGNDSSFYKEKYKDKFLRVLSGYWVKISLSTTWYEPEDIRLDEVLAIAKANSEAIKKTRTYTSSPFAINSFVRSLLENFGNRITFTASDYASATTEESKKAKAARHGYATADLMHDALFRRSKIKAPTPAERLGAGFKEIFGSIDALEEKELLDKINGLTIKNVASDDFTGVYQEIAPAEYHEPAKVWFSLIKKWRKSKRYSRNDQMAGSVGYLLLYMFVYLPWWYRRNQNASKLPPYPKNPNLMNGAIFMASLSDEGVGLPLDYVSFMEKIEVVPEIWTGA